MIAPVGADDHIGPRKAPFRVGRCGHRPLQVEYINTSLNRNLGFDRNCEYGDITKTDGKKLYMLTCSYFTPYYDMLNVRFFWRISNDHSNKQEEENK